MNGSRTIRVLKHDGQAERFDPLKLAASMWRAIEQTGGQFAHARELAGAIGLYLRENECKCISSSAIFEMSLTVLRRVQLTEAAGKLESHSFRRDLRRRTLRICHDSGKITAWSKGWLCELAQRIWNLSPSVARIIAGAIEEDLLACETKVVSRREVLEMLNARVAEYGLADAVPVQ